MSSSIANHNPHEDRRRSVLPTTVPAATLLRPCAGGETDSGSLDESAGTSLLRRASSAAQSFRRVSRAFCDEGPTKGFLRAAMGDPNRPKYMQLAIENDELHVEWKRLRGYVQSFEEEYKASKEAIIDPYRRYKRLQAMVKKLILHLRLNDPVPLAQMPSAGKSGERKSGPVFAGGQVLQSSVREREMRQKHTNICDSLTTEQLARETERMRDRNTELQGRIDLVVDGINALEIAYKTCKEAPIVLRYLRLKSAAKTFLSSCNF
ncbi:unnamed protein product [Mesocestoides corti]|uniref:OTU domain-containing protein n=1 Tax=Mesocestoides corti TaxID=53468 RepID=A0A0R3UNQ1_MESCO|nr:unnamed protein product [Mesocestoides corti]